MNDIPAFSSTAEALGTLRAAMGFLAAADATAMPAAVQAQCLQTLEEIDSVEVVARASVLRAFSAGLGYCGDGEYSAKTWLVHKTQITRGAAAVQMKWVRRTAGHPVVAAALAEAVVSESWARAICQQTGRLPAERRDEADAILLAAVAGGATLEDLLALGEKMYEMSCSGAPDDYSGGNAGGGGAGGGGEGAGGGGEGAGGGQGGGDPVFDGRSVRLATTFGGAGVLAGDLTPECAACHVHHVRHKARGGKTSLKDRVLLCAFHHLVAIHRWGWTLALNGDGTTTAWNKDHTKVLHSHAPPTTRAG